MENEILKKGIQEIKEIKLSSLEKENILKSILNNTVPAKAPVKSPYSFLSFVYGRRFSYYAVALVLLLLVSSGGIYLSSQRGQVAQLPKNEVPTENKIIEPEKQPAQIALNNNPNEPKNNTTPSGTKNTPKEISKPKIIAKNTTPNTSPTISMPFSLPPGSTTGKSASAPSTTATSVNTENSEFYLEIAKRAFGEWLQKESKIKAPFLDYKIDELKIVAYKRNNNPKDAGKFYGDNTENAFIVTISYAIQTTKENTLPWMTNLTLQNMDGWILNEYIEAVVDQDINGKYFMEETLSPNHIPISR